MFISFYFLVLQDTVQSIKKGNVSKALPRPSETILLARVIALRLMIFVLLTLLVTNSIYLFTRACLSSEIGPRLTSKTPRYLFAFSNPYRFLVLAMSVIHLLIWYLPPVYPFAFCLLRGFTLFEFVTPIFFD